MFGNDTTVDVPISSSSVRLDIQKELETLEAGGEMTSACVKVVKRIRLPTAV